MIDNELKELAALALRNAFYEEFSGLVNAYLEASEGLIEHQESLLNEMVSVFGRNTKVEADKRPNIWTDQKANPLWTSCRHRTLLEALEMSTANRIGLNGKVIFERIDNEWIYEYEYRVKPSTKKYRVALFKDSFSGDTHTSTAETLNGAERYEAVPNFVRWLTDWIEYEE